jgi:YHS domain-containing protein
MIRYPKLGLARSGAIAFCTVVLLLASLSGALRAETFPRLAAAQGVAVNGYDPVAYFTEGRAVQGRAEIALRWRGVRWHFTNEAHRATFEANPRAYAPQFGGFCAVGISEGLAVTASPDLWVIHEGRLYLAETPAKRALLAADPSAVVSRARSNWARPAAAMD